MSATLGAERYVTAQTQLAERGRAAGGGEGGEEVEGAAEGAADDSWMCLVTRALNRHGGTVYTVYKLNSVYPFKLESAW